MKTEIHLNEPFGYTIFQVIMKYELKRNLEIGSWDGEGSTRCFVEAMKLLSGEKSLYCIEIVEDKFNVLKARYADIDFVECFKGSSVAYVDLLYKNFDEIWDSPFNKLSKTNYSKETVKGWFDRDVETLSRSPAFLHNNTDDITCSFHMEYDSVLIDGSEFTGYSEFKLLENRTKVFFLDDVHYAFKCNQVYRELCDSPKWRLLADLPHARNGSAIFIRRS